MLSRVFILCFLIWTSTASSQNKTFQLGPFNANFQVDFESTCYEGKYLTVQQKADTYYYLGEDAEVMEANIKLSSPYVKDFKVFKRTTYAHGISFETEGAILYKDSRANLRFASKTLFCSEWTELDLEDNVFTPTSKAPRWPDDSFLEACPVQAEIDKTEMNKLLTSHIKDRYNYNISKKTIESMLNSKVKVLKEAVEIQIRYKEGKESKVITIIFFEKWGEC
ncbi:MAG: hypothetical protein GY810_28035 [Aureispira sp.]|nr:hypothetical protein [Aureispira sp.]